MLQTEMLKMLKENHKICNKLDKFYRKEMSGNFLAVAEMSNGQLVSYMLPDSLPDKKTAWLFAYFVVERFAQQYGVTPEEFIGEILWAMKNKKL